MGKLIAAVRVGTNEKMVDDHYQYILSLTLFTYLSLPFIFPLVIGISLSLLSISYIKPTLPSFFLFCVIHCIIFPFGFSLFVHIKLILLSSHIAFSFLFPQFLLVNHIFYK